MKLLYFIFIFYGFIGLYSFATRKYRNPFKLIMIFGKKGSGKSTLLVKEALKYKKKGYDIWTNMKDLQIDGCHYFDPLCLGQYSPGPKSALFIDEVGMIWDARHFKEFKDYQRDWFKLQRHYHCVVFLASQTWDIDAKLRALTDKMYLVVNVATVFSVAKAIRRSIVLTESTSEAESRISENLKFRSFWNWKYTFIPKYAKYFQSFNAPALELPPSTTFMAEPTHGAQDPRRLPSIHFRKKVISK